MELYQILILVFVLINMIGFFIYASFYDKYDVFIPMPKDFKIYIVFFFKKI